MTKWITTEEFAHLSPINVFGKEHAFSQPVESHYFNKHILFRKKTDLPDFEKATLRISADDYYKLYINGSFVCMGPCKIRRALSVHCVCLVRLFLRLLQRELYRHSVWLKDRKSVV